MLFVYIWLLSDDVASLLAYDMALKSQKSYNQMSHLAHLSLFWKKKVVKKKTIKKEIRKKKKNRKKKKEHDRIISNQFTL